MIDLARYGIEESIGLHIVLSNSMWWISVLLAVTAYKYRQLWNVGDMPWTFLFLTFLCFGIRELGHFSKSDYIGSIRYVFGIWSAVFMASAFIYLCVRICQRKKDSKLLTYAPFAFVIIFPAIMFYLYFSGTDISNLKKIMNTIENIVWIIASSTIIYTTYMLGTQTSGRFTKVFMFFQFSAYSAFLWKLMGLLESMGSPIPYSIREITETLIGIFAIAAMYVLTKMLRELSKNIYSE